MTARAAGSFLSSSTWVRRVSIGAAAHGTAHAAHGQPSASELRTVGAGCLAVRSTPRSLGTESNPHAGTIRAPVRLAVSWCAAITRWTKITSPVMSQ